MFFSEEKNQKTFTSGARGKMPAMASIMGVQEGIKVFCFFSSEKKTLLQLFDLTAVPPRRAPPWCFWLQ
jgi:hypothetical protein